MHFLGSGTSPFVDCKETFDDPNSDEMFRLVDSWVADCLKIHPDCGTKNRSILPKRLIDVGPIDGSQVPFLLENPETLPENLLCATEIRYTALSYCWGLEYCGTKSPLTTTASAIEARKRGFDMEKLPRTIYDAILLTRRLRIQYLWVDALCILQGDSEIDRADWKRESVKMGDVYGGAFLTIAAASARAMHDGIFHARNPPKKAPTELFLTSDNFLGLKGPVFVGLKRLFVDSMDEPLFHRGWTLQERLLSRRVLICKRDQFVWECQSGVVAENGVGIEGIAETRLRMTGLESPETWGISEIWHPAVEWQVIMTDYSARSLSQSSDKLIAITGLAKEFASIHGRKSEEYLAGLLAHGFMDHLLWVHKAITISKRQQHGRPSKYRAPSWSFAAVDGNIRWILADQTGSGPYYTQLKGSHIVTSSEQPFSQVSSGYVTLRGPLKCIKSTKKEAVDFDSVMATPTSNDDIQSEPEFDFYPDVSVERDISELLYSLQKTPDSKFWFLHIKEGAVLVLLSVPQLIWSPERETSCIRKGGGRAFQGFYGRNNHTVLEGSQCGRS